ncbi:hypothetical protein HDV63DRAFT_396834 [Trichoderma sp. SZMC 28014]
MRLPEAPIKSLEQTKEWMRTAPEDIRDPKFLWKDCWERFNTIQMPITSTQEYFDIAIKIAKVSHDKSSFEKLFRQTIRQRQAEVTKWYADFKRNAWREGQSFPCGTARVLAVEFCRTGSLNCLLQILDGVAYGWKNEDHIIVGRPNEPLSDDGLDDDSDDGSEVPLTQFWEEGEELWYDGMTPPDISNLPHVRDRDVSEAPTIESSNSRHRKPPSSSISTGEHLRQLSQQNIDAKCEHHTENEKSPQKRMRFDDAARVDDAAQSNDESDDYTSFPSHQPTESTQHASEYPPKKRRRLDDPTETERFSMASNRASSGRRTEERTRANDDCNDGRGLKRQRLKSRTKRLKTDVDDKNDERHGRKRRKLTMTKAKANNEVKGSRGERRKRISSSPRAKPPPPTNTLNTRSTRRTGPFMLWELDNTSQPREIR